MEWINVKDKLPEGLCNVLVWDEKYLECKIGFYSYIDREWYLDGGDEDGFAEKINPTYWMPLPEKPDEC